MRKYRNTLSHRLNISRVNFFLFERVAHVPPPRARTRLHDFHLVEFSHQPVPFPVKQRVETTG